MIVHLVLSMSSHLAMAGNAVANASPVRVNSDSGRFTGSVRSPVVNRELNRCSSRRDASGKRTDSSANFSNVNVLFSTAGNSVRILFRCDSSIQRISSARPKSECVRARDRNTETSSAVMPLRFSSAVVNGCIVSPGLAHTPALVAAGVPSIPFHKNSAIGERQRFAVQTKSISDTFAAYPKGRA